MFLSFMLKFLDEKHNIILAILFNYLLYYFVFVEIFEWTKRKMSITITTRTREKSTHFDNEYAFVTTLALSAWALLKHKHLRYSIMKIKK